MKTPFCLLALISSNLKFKNKSTCEIGRHLLGLEEQDRDMAEVEVDEVFRLMSNEGAEIASNDAVPRRAFSLIKL